ncbi:uncharacterized protein BDW43DRAFT_307934 [Aspergillus alliaceus]|uniref:uncharacterized protein n=1 Tax=Petromyces alliaceus TaxID=209559 RepID=UPI0012A6BBB5|nr:uncharacterized protein BDW43DRAFT_307934 [Aspergillus alliaceus]KAB8236920.1 hypothetical protein BDW43DRAFT_307934 [Aspergillus alliaceus]
MTDDSPNRRTTIPTSPYDENFSERSPQRTAVLRKLQVILDELDVPVPFWAFCQLANVNLLCCARLWAQEPPKFPDNISVASSDASSRSSGRSRRLAELARERDGGICILSKSAPCDVAHIFAHYLLKPKNKPTASDRCVPTIWSVLFLFWPREQVEKWKNSVVHDNSNGAADEDGVFNLLCLRPDLQRAWAQGRFALRPMNLSDDKKAMDLEFHWMPRYDHTYDATISIVEQPLSTRNIDRVDECFIFRESGERVVSGSIFRLNTSAPIRLPLPSFDLLEMAWHVARIVSMSASGLLNDQDFHFEGDDDDIRPVSVPEHVLEWIPPPQTPSSYASSIEAKESPMTSTNPSPAKSRTAGHEVTNATPSGRTLEHGGVMTEPTG